MSIGFLTSVLVPHLRLAMPTAIGFFFTTYLLGTFSGMIDSLEFLKYLSPFHYAVPSELIKNGFDGVNILLAFVIIVISISTTYIVYRKKDFKI
jgi:ABC-2 type transport system permease protein